MQRKSVLVGAIVVLVSVCASTFVVAASFQGLGDLPGGEFKSVALAVSAHGSVVVGYSISTSGQEAFRWTSGGGMVGLGDLPGGPFSSSARGVSADGSVIVGRSTPAVYEAFRWGSGVMTGLGTLPLGGIPSSTAHAVSGDGSVVVGYASGTNGSEAFRWENGTMTGLGYLPGYDEGSVACGISDDGSVIVGYCSGFYGFYWEDGVMSSLSNVRDMQTAPYDVSDDGSVIVGTARTEAFRWKNGEITLLPDLAGSTQSNAYAVSGDGEIIVGGSNGDEGAFIWDAENGTRSIKDVLELDYGLDLTGWTLRNAQGISSDGLTFVGAGINPDGYTEAWIATIRQPTPPVANAGADQTVSDADDSGHEEVTLDGSSSCDSDGSIISWVWTDDFGDTIPDGETPTATLYVGVHTITLTVTDDDGLADSDTVIITVKPRPGLPPVADANGPYAIFVDDPLTLDASGSTDADNDIVSYVWDLDDNNSFESDAGIEPVFDVNYAYLQWLGLLVNHTYTIHLKVTDGENQSDTADSTLTILPKPALQVAVDIKPTSCPNPMNIKSSGVLPVAILGTEDVNVTDIDPTSIELAGVSVVRHSYEDIATPAADSNDCNCTTDGPDGLLDLTLKFKTQDIVEELVRAEGELVDGEMFMLEVTGVLFGERPIEGVDCVLIKGKAPKGLATKIVDINRDGVIDFYDFAALANEWLQTYSTE